MKAPTATTTFAFEARVVACEECGAPLVIGGASGLEPCSFCGAHVEARPVSRAIERAPQIGEIERLASLRAQDHRVRSLAPELVALAPGGQLPAWKVGEALSRWKSARAELRATQHPAAAETLLFLTEALSLHFAEAEDPLRERALLESALDTLERPAHRQSVCCALARSACRGRDFAAAEAWLAACDPTPHELQADSAFRFARAYLDTALGRPEAVLAALGPSHAEVPIAGEYEAACIALRANAWEKLGRVDTATDLLDHFKSHMSGVERFLASRFVDQHAHLGLCARSEPEADARQRSRGLKLAGESSGAPLIAFIFVLGFAVAGAIALLIFGGSFSALVNIAYFVGLMESAFFVVFVSDLVKWIRARRLRARGVPALAQVRHVRPGYQVTMGVPELRYRVLVMPLHGYPYEAISLLHATPELRQKLPIGAVTVVRVDPYDKNQVYIEID